MFHLRNSRPGGLTASKQKTFPLRLLAICSLEFFAALAQADVLFVSTQSDSKIHRVGSSGAVSDYETGLSTPTGVVFDENGNLFVANYATGTADGSIVEFPAGGGASTPLASGLNGPTGLAFDSSGSLYAAISGDHKIIKFSSGGGFTTFATLAAGSGPQAIAFDPNDNLFIANKLDSTIVQVTPSGSVSTFSNKVTNPTGVGFDSTGTIYAVDTGSGGEIVKFNPAGKTNSIASGITDPRGLAIDHYGNFYVASGGDNSLKKVTTTHAISTFASGLTNASLIAVRIPQVRLIAQKNEALTDPTGTEFAKIGSPATGNSGDVAYRATLITGIGGVTSSNNTGIWVTSDNGSRSLIARTGIGTAPGTNSAIYSALSDPVINNQGNIAFRGTLKSGVGDAKSTNLAGIWSNSSGTLSLIARSGMQPPGNSFVTGSRFAAFSSLVLPDQGGVAFFATAAGTGVTSSNNVGIWASDSGGNLRLIVRKHDIVTVDGASKTISALTLFSKVPFSYGQSHSVSEAGNLCYRATFTDGSSAIFRVDQSTGNSAVVTYKGEVFSSTPVGAKVASVTTAAINDSQTVAFRGTLVSGVGGITSSNNMGIWTDTTTPSRAIVAQKGFPAPGTTGAVFNTFSDPVLNNGGKVAFRGALRSGVGDAVSGKLLGLWSDFSGSLTLVARQTVTQPPGLSSGTKFTAFNSFVLPDSTGLAFYATVAGTGITTANNVGIWAVDADGVLQLISRKGDQVTVDGVKKTISSLTIFPPITYVAAQSRNFAPSGTLAYQTSFTDGTQAVFQVVFP